MIGAVRRKLGNWLDVAKMLVPAGVEVVKALIENKPLVGPEIKPPPSHSKAVEAPDRDRERARKTIEGLK